MITFQNTTSKGNFENYLNYVNLHVEKQELLSVRPESIRNKSAWKILDQKYGHVWDLVFDTVKNEYELQHDSYYEHFTVKMDFNNNSIRIFSAVDNGRKVKADKFLKKYCQLAMMVNCLLMYGYLN